MTGDTKIVIRKGKTGIKSHITEDLLDDIKSLVHEGIILSQIPLKLGIKVNTFNKWYYSNQENLYERVKLWQTEYMLKEAERVSAEILSLDARNGGESYDPSLLAVKQRESAFLREKLVIARDKYDTKTTTIVNVVAPQPILGNIFDEPKKIESDVV